MKTKLLETEIWRHQMVAAFNEAREEYGPNCMIATSATAVAGLSRMTRTEPNQKTLVLVSDDGSLGVRLGNTADLAGLTFLQINDSGHALRLAIQERPTVVFLDLDLPALTGWKASEQFLEDEQCPPLVLLTGRTDHFGLEAAVRAGTIVDKSASSAQLLQKMNGVLAEPGTEQVNRRAAQRLLIRWLRPYEWTARMTSVNWHWGINE